MKTATKEVKSDSKVVGQAEFFQFDSVDEAVQEMTSEKVLKLVNAQVQTDAMNIVRATATSKPSKIALERMAMASITVEEFQAVAGDRFKLDQLVAKKVAEIERTLPPTKVKDQDDEQ